MRRHIDEIRTDRIQGVRQFFVATLPVLFATVLVGCAQPESFGSVNGQTMGTYYRVQAPSSCLPPSDVLENRLDELNAALSTYDPGSELARINTNAQALLTVNPSRYTAPVRISDDLATVAQAAQAMAERSGGAFDPTVGPLVNLWGFGPDEDSSSKPSAAAQAAAAALVGSRRVRFLNGTLSVQAGTYIDLSAIAKGFAVDALARVLERRGCDDYMIDIGGEMRLAGNSARGTAWRIGIERPDPASLGDLQQVLVLTDTAIATSGDYRNFRVVDGRRVDHVIDPRVGRPAESDVVSATVLHTEAMWADALATTLLVLGASEGLALADREGVAALIIRHADETRQGGERYTVEMNAAMAQQVKTAGASTE